MKEKFCMVVLFAVLLVSACGGGSSSDGGGGTTISALKGLAACTATAGEAVICGVAYAPDGKTPIVGAEVFEQSASAMTISLKGLSSDGAGKTDANDSHCLTDDTGAFACAGILEGGALNFRITGGGFTIDFSAQVAIDAITDIPAASTTATGGTGTDKYAVVYGRFDSIQVILARVLGCGTVNSDGELVSGTECSQIELVDFSGTNPNTALTNALGLEAGTYPTLEDFLTNANTPAALALFKGIFFNCGMSELYQSNSEVKTALQNYVNNGGNLYASDWAYGYIENIWPDAIEFYGDDAITADALVGSINSAQSVNVDNASLLTWLRAEGLVAADASSFDVNFNLPGWVVMTDKGTGTTELLSATSLPNGPTDVSNIPITVDFSSGSGCVFYTSYHNEAPGEVSVDATQARVLEYLLINRFGNCS